MFVKIGDSIKFKGFSCGIPREEAILRKSKTRRKSPEKWIFLSLAFYNAPSSDTVECFMPQVHAGQDVVHHPNKQLPSRDGGGVVCMRGGGHKWAANIRHLM